MGVVSEIPVNRFLRLPFATVSDGGFAGLVFLVSRSADAPELHRDFFAQWTDIHDVTRRFLAVITPSPGMIALDEQSYPTQYRTAVAGLQCPFAEDRLSQAVRGHPSAVSMADGRDRAVVAADLPASVSEHQSALTAATSALQAFFGISESLLPCAVVVSLHEQTVHAVALDKNGSVYDLLKLIKTCIEPTAARIVQLDAELAAAKAARSTHRDRGRLATLRSTAASVTGQWAAQKQRLADDLIRIARAHDGEVAELSGWMARRLAGDEPLDEADWTAARQLRATLLATSGFGTVPRRLGRVLAKLSSGYPDGREALRRLAEADAVEAANQRRVGEVKADLDRLGRELRLGASVISAAERLGLVPVAAKGLLPWRELSWPITVIGKPERPAPTLLTRRA